VPSGLVNSFLTPQDAASSDSIVISISFFI
jgi:hypothetical protein